MKVLQIALIALMGLVLAAIGVVAAIYGVINYRGAQEWAAAQRELKAKGETIEWSAFVPAPVKEQDNLAFAPFFVRQLNYQNDPRTGFYGFGPANARPSDLKDMPYGSGGKPAGLRISGWDLARHTDLATYARVYDEAHQLPYPQPGDPVAGALAGLAPYAPALDELARAAAERPLTRFPVDWNTENVFGLALPQNNLQLQFVRALRLRASIELAAGHTNEALRDVELALRLCRDMRAEPSLMAHLVQISCLNFILSPIWEGLADRRWSAADLTRLQADLQPFDLLVTYQHAIRAERASTAGRGIDYLSTHLEELPGIVRGADDGSAGERLFYKRVGLVAPRGWFDSNKATMARLMQEYFVESVDPRAHRVFPAKAAAATAALARLPSRPGNLMARLSLPIYGSVSARTARLQAGLDEATVACALERFALDHASAPAAAYPETLAELAPAYLDRAPMDVVSGEAMHYRRTPDGRYCLYEIGWNDRDDGGQVAWQSGGQLLDNQAGDWVWQYAELPSKP